MLPESKLFLLSPSSGRKLDPWGSCARVHGTRSQEDLLSPASSLLRAEKLRLRRGSQESVLASPRLQRRLARPFSQPASLMTTPAQSVPAEAPPTSLQTSCPSTIRTRLQAKQANNGLTRQSRLTCSKPEVSPKPQVCPGKPSTRIPCPPKPSPASQFQGKAGRGAQFEGFECDRQ